MPDRKELEKRNHFEPHKVKHTLGLQRSQYLCIEDNMENLKQYTKYEACEHASKDDDAAIKGMK